VRYYGLHGGGGVWRVLYSLLSPPFFAHRASSAVCRAPFFVHSPSSARNREPPVHGSGELSTQYEVRSSECEARSNLLSPPAGPQESARGAGRISRQHHHRLQRQRLRLPAKYPRKNHSELDESAVSSRPMRTARTRGASVMPSTIRTNCDHPNTNIAPPPRGARR
jgi:hypothetical protein